MSDIKEKIDSVMISDVNRIIEAMETEYRRILLAAFDALNSWKDNHVEMRRRDVLGHELSVRTECECELCIRTRAALALLETKR